MDENLLLSLIENNAKMEVVDLAAALNETEENVDKTIKDLEKNKTIYGYHTLINWDKTNHDVCTAVIQVNAKPERDYGYDRIAKKIYNFPEVDTMYLLAGNYEFLLIVKGKTMVEVAKFVNSRLAVIEGIERTATMYVLKQYKNMGKLVEDDNKDAAERLLDKAEDYKKGSTSIQTNKNAWRENNLDERLSYSLIKGITEYIDEDLEEGEYRELTDEELATLKNF